MRIFIHNFESRIQTYLRVVATNTLKISIKYILQKII